MISVRYVAEKFRTSAVVKMDREFVDFVGITTGVDEELREEYWVVMNGKWEVVERGRLYYLRSPPGLFSYEFGVEIF